MVKIGVFDSGIGGEAVAERIRQLFPDTDVMVVNDSDNVPYGTKTSSEIARLTLVAIRPLINAQCDAIVIACNTATTNAISALRAAHPTVHFVGIEPMIKPAALMTKTNTIAVLATTGTLASTRYTELKRHWASGVTVIEPDCETWAERIEHGNAEQIDIRKTIDDLRRQNTDVIVLGCTHYHWLKDRIQMVAGSAVTVLEPSDAIGARLDSLLSISSVLPE